MICKNCHKEFDSNFSNCPYCNYPAYSQDNSNLGANNQTNSQSNSYTYQNVNSNPGNSGYSNAQSSAHYSSQSSNAYNQQNRNSGYCDPDYNNCNNSYSNSNNSSYNNNSYNNQSNSSYNSYNNNSYDNQNNRSYNNPNPHPQEADDVITLMKVLGFFLGLLMPIFWFLPLISLVLYFVWKKSKPKTASAIGKFTIIGLIVGWGLVLLLAVLAIVIFIVFAAGPLFEFAKHLIVELIKFVPFESIRELIESIFGLLPFNIDFDLSGVSMLSLF